MSVPVQLEKGKIYFMEALMKYDVAGNRTYRSDHIAVAVTLPSGAVQRPISQEHIYFRSPGIIFIF